MSVGVFDVHVLFVHTVISSRFDEAMLLTHLVCLDLTVWLCRL
jgi:hypothetical protein